MKTIFRWQSGFHFNGIKLYPPKCYDLSRVDGFIFSKGDTEDIAEFVNMWSIFEQISLFCATNKKSSKTLVTRVQPPFSVRIHKIVSETD